jgi:hypothetical protein
VPAQPPVETPPINATTTTPTPTPTAVPPATTTTPAPTPAPDILGELAGFFASPLNIVMILIGVLAVVGILFLIVRAVQSLHAHPLGKKLGSWLTSPGVDAIIIGLDPDTRECALLPAKRVGSLYVSIEDGSIIVPVGGGESYTIRGSGKPALIALVHHKHGVQHNPAAEQIISLSLTPIEGKEDIHGIKDARRALLSYLQKESSMITGEIYISPKAKLYISAKAPRVLELLRKEIAYTTDAALVAVSSSTRTFAEEGTRIQMLRERLEITKKATMIWLALIAIIIVAVALMILKFAGLI